MRVCFCFNTETNFIRQISNIDQWKERNLYCKIHLGFFKRALRLRDQHLFIRGLLKIKQPFLHPTLVVIFYKERLYLENWRRVF